MPSLKIVWLLLGTGLLAAPALAADQAKDTARKTASATTSTNTSASARSTYQQDRAACLAGQTGQDRATCLREAGAALQQSRQIGGEDSTQLERNRLARCDTQPAQDRQECVRRMNEGRVTGSVEGGGVVRELTTIVPARSTN